jgi:hypothetical protein
MYRDNMKTNKNGWTFLDWCEWGGVSYSPNDKKLMKLWAKGVDPERIPQSFQKLKAS